MTGGLLDGFRNDRTSNTSQKGSEHNFMYKYRLYKPHTVQSWHPFKSIGEKNRHLQRQNISFAVIKSLE
jgi:hypothetical protein